MNQDDDNPIGAAPTRGFGRRAFSRRRGRQRHRWLGWASAVLLIATCGVSPSYAASPTGGCVLWYRQPAGHVSHLYGLYPSEQITLRATPDLAAAARQSLDFRGDGPVGWARAWNVCLWARLEDPELAHDRLVRLIAQNANPNLFNKCWENRPLPFQIDANFGGTAGIAGMLLQSHAGVIALMPAWPKHAWPAGRVKGLRARGGVEVDMAWSDGRLATVTLKADVDGRHRIRPPNGHAVEAIRSGAETVPIEIQPDGTAALEVQSGREYELALSPRLE